jgi:hypothetical protein
MLMLRRLVAAATLLVAACGAPAPAPLAVAVPSVAPAPLEAPVAAASVRAEPPSEAAAALSEHAPARSDEVERIDLAPPEGLACTVRGRGRLSPDTCDTGQLTVSQRRDGKQLIAVVSPNRMPVTWGFFGDEGRAWIHAEDAGIRVAGFVEHKAERFTLHGETPVMLNHVWLLDQATVRVRGGGEAGAVVVSVADDSIDGVGELRWKVSCDSLGFDPLPRRRLSPSRPAQRKFPSAVPRTSTLRLRTAPREKPFATLTSAPDEKVSVQMEILQVLGDWSRVRFQTTHARFDVWVASQEIEPHGALSLRGFGSRGCRRSRSSGLQERAVLLDDTNVFFGPPLVASPVAGLAFSKGAEVVVGARSRGYARVEPLGDILSHGGEYFYVPEALLSLVPAAP